MEELRLKLKLQYFGHLTGRADSLNKTLILGKTEGRRKRGRLRIRWLDVRELEQTVGDSEGQGSLVCRSPYGVAKSQTEPEREHKSEKEVTTQGSL